MQLNVFLPTFFWREYIRVMSSTTGLLCALVLLGSSVPPADALSLGSGPIAGSRTSPWSGIRRMSKGDVVVAGLSLRLRGGQGAEMGGGEEEPAAPTSEGMPQKAADVEEPERMVR